MQKTNNHQLIIRILNNQITPWPEDKTDDDSALFIETAQQHGVLALLDGFREQLEKNSWPPLILQSIAIANKAAEQILAQRKNTVTRVFDAFAENGIDALMFKGAANAYLLYTHPHHRTHADIDILIREAQFPKVKECLSMMGFELDNINPTKYGPAQSGAILRQQDKTPHAFDIHWKINNRLALAKVLDFDELDRRAIPVEQYGCKVKALSYADAVLAACIHEAGALDGEKGRLISLYDVHLLLNKLDNRQIQGLTAMACKKKIGAVYSHYLNLCLSTFKNNGRAAQVSNVIQNFKFQQNEITAKLLRGNRSWANNQWLDICSVDGAFGKLGLIMSKLKRKF